MAAEDIKRRSFFPLQGSNRDAVAAWQFRDQLEGAESPTRPVLAISTGHRRGSGQWGGGQFRDAHSSQVLHLLGSGLASEV